MKELVVFFKYFKYNYYLLAINKIQFKNNKKNFSISIIFLLKLIIFFIFNFYLLILFYFFYYINYSY